MMNLTPGIPVLLKRSVFSQKEPKNELRSPPLAYGRKKYIYLLVSENE